MKPDPSKSILNRDWKYIPSGETNVAKRFAAERKRRADAVIEAERAAMKRVTPIKAKQ